MYHIDPIHTFVFFGVQHLVVGRVRGRFDSFAGTLTVDDDLAKWRLDVSIESASVDTQNERRDADVRGSRFFDSLNFPQITYRAVGLLSESGGCWSTAGDLTIRGVTRPAVLTGRFIGLASDHSGTTRAAYQATAKIRRRDYGLLAEIDGESGGLVVGHDITVEIDAEVIREQVEAAPAPAAGVPSTAGSHE